MLSAKVKIGFISYEFPPDTGKGGIGTYTFQISHLLGRNNFDVHVFAASGIRSIIEYNENLVIHWVLAADPIDFQSKVLEKFIQEEGKGSFQFIESSEIHGNAMKIKELFPNIPLIIKLHASNHLVEGTKRKYFTTTDKLRFFIGSLVRGKWDLGYWKKYEKENDIDYKISKIADKLISPSRIMNIWALENWKVTNKIEIVNNPFIINASLLGIPKITEIKNKTILYFGRLNVIKGLVNFTKAVKKILRNNPEWRLIIVGDDGAGPRPKYSSMKNWIQNELDSCSQQVTFSAGIEQKDLPVIFSECEIVVIPSLFESFSYVGLEAMASARAIIISQNAGISDFIVNNHSGLIVNPKSVQKIHDSIQKLISEPELMFRLSKNARLEVINFVENDNILNFYKGFSESLT